MYTPGGQPTHLSSLSVLIFTSVKNSQPYCWRDQYQVEAFAAMTLSPRGSFTVVNLMQFLNAQLRIPLTDWGITIPFNWQKSSANAHCPISSRFIWCQHYWNGAPHYSNQALWSPRHEAHWRPISCECGCHLGIDSRTQQKCPKVPQRKEIGRIQKHLQEC